MAEGKKKIRIKRIKVKRDIERLVRYLSCEVFGKERGVRGDEFLQFTRYGIFWYLPPALSAHSFDPWNFDLCRLKELAQGIKRALLICERLRRFVDSDFVIDGVSYKDVVRVVQPDYQVLPWEKPRDEWVFAMSPENLASESSVFESDAFYVKLNVPSTFGWDEVKVKSFYQEYQKSSMKFFQKMIAETENAYRTHLRVIEERIKKAKAICASLELSPEHRMLPEYAEWFKEFIAALNDVFYIEEAFLSNPQQFAVLEDVSRLLRRRLFATRVEVRFFDQFKVELRGTLRLQVDKKQDICKKQEAVGRLRKVISRFPDLENLKGYLEDEKFEFKCGGDVFLQLPTFSLHETNEDEYWETFKFFEIFPPDAVKEEIAFKKWLDNYEEFLNKRLAVCEVSANQKRLRKTFL